MYLSCPSIYAKGTYDKLVSRFDTIPLLAQKIISNNINFNRSNNIKYSIQFVSKVVATKPLKKNTNHRLEI